MHEVIQLKFSTFLQESHTDYHEAQQFLVEGLRVRRKYMNISLQSFCSTTDKMLDSELPPSSEFCIPGSADQTVHVTSAGDVIDCKWLPGVIVGAYNMLGKCKVYVSKCICCSAYSTHSQLHVA